MCWNSIRTLFVFQRPRCNVLTSPVHDGVADDSLNSIKSLCFEAHIRTILLSPALFVKRKKKNELFSLDYIFVADNV